MKGNVVDHEFVVGDFFIVEDESTVSDVRQRALECEAVEVVGEGRLQTVSLDHVIQPWDTENCWVIAIHADFAY